MRPLASIDIGTLTCRLLVGTVSSEGLVRTIDEARTLLWLGEGVDRDKRLRPAAMARVIDTMRAWKTLIDRHDVERYAAVATSAVRDAVNRDEFVERVARETGMAIDVLDGAEEARRTCLGIRAGLPPDARDVLGVDIGGGSTELMVSRPGRAPTVTSLDLGVVRLTERALRGDPPTAEDMRRAETMVRDLIRRALRDIGDVTGLTLVGTAGTITSLAAMAQALPVYDPARLHRYPLTLATVRRMERDVRGMSRAALAGMPGLEPGREDVIAAGTLILRCLMEELRAPHCVVSVYGLREGVLVHLARSCHQNKI